MQNLFMFACILCVDIVIVYTLDLGGTLLKFPTRNMSYNLLRQWAESGLRCTLLYTGFTLSKNAAAPLIRRWVIVHCFIGSVYETLRFALFYYSLEKINSWIVGTMAAALACIFWENMLPDSSTTNNEKEPKQRARVLLFRVIRLYKPDYLLLCGAFIFLASAVLCEMFIPLYTGEAIDILGSHYQWDNFRSVIFFMGLFSLGSSFSAGCRGGLFTCVIYSFIYRVKMLLFGSLVRQDIGFFETVKTGDITSRLSTDTELMGDAVALNVNVFLRTLIKTMGVLYLMRLSKEVQDSLAQTNNAAAETVSSIRTVKSFRSELGEARRYDVCLIETHNLKTRRDTVSAIYLLLTELGMKVVMLYYGRLFIQYGQMSTGNLVSFILYQQDLGDNIRTLISIIGDMLNSVGAAGKVFEYLDRKSEVSIDGNLMPKDLKGHVKFQNLTFSYPRRPDHNVLKDFSLELKPGQMTALVGISGGGKSTCVSLLERFYQPQQGHILLDGQPLQDYQHKYLHSKIAMVGQEPVLFSGTVRDNIAYGLQGCTMERVIEAASKANAHAFISKLEKGYDTVIKSGFVLSDVGERANLLSGGEKQRIAIARALIREPQVLILDEVTSSLDTESEQMVQQALSCCPALTLLVIAHRLKTIERADQIVVIDSGELVEKGTHEELMDKKGSYYKLRERLFSDDKTTNQDKEKSDTVKTQ
nr:novel protein similar to human transporter 2, ATP-binding cassette, sub-family B (MDR/TAP2) [Danio rerio]